MKKGTILLSLAVLFAVSCAKSDLETQQVSNVSSTPCKQGILKSSGLSDEVEVEFTNKGVQIKYYNFEVPCDFTTVNITHTFVNGVLHITQQGYPNQADCVCHSDVSYTIEGISQNEVNVIFINGVQVYCHNDKEDDQTENLLVGKWLSSNNHTRGSDTIVFTENFYVRQYLDYIFANQVTPALYLPPFVTYSLLNDEITFTIHYSYPSAQKIDEPFKYVLNGNSLTIKGFSNPFSLTAEARSDVHFTKVIDEIDEEGQITDSEKLCPYLNIENINKAIPIINDYLAGLPSSNSFAEDEQNLQALTKWLKSSPCIIDATILCVSCIYTLPAQSEISFSFQEGEVTKVVTLDISMSNPLKARICKIQGASYETNVTLKNTESYTRTFVLGDEEGASIPVQAQHYETSELVRDESTNMNVEYRYKPTSGFVGNDYVILEIYYNKTGENSSAYTETERINFTITN